MSYSVLIADDEPLALSQISSLLAHDEELSVISVCKNGVEAATAIESKSPDIAILDVELPGMSGLDIADRFANGNGPRIIFVSPSEEHACRSFELDVLDYVLKPVRKERFLESVARAKRALLQERANTLSNRIASLVAEYTAEVQVSREEDDACFVTRSGERLHYLEMSDVVWVEASNQYLTLHTVDDSFMLSQSLSSFLKEHQHSTLCRIHRSHAVNLEAVEEVHKLACGRTEVRLSNGENLAVSRSRQSVVPTLLRWAHDLKKRRAG